MKHLKGKQFTFQGISSRDAQKESDVKNMILEQENQFPENYGGEKLKSSKIKNQN